MERTVTVAAATTAPVPAIGTAIAVLPPHAPPQIISVSLSRSSARGGDVVTGIVRTSSNVASVEARVVGYGQVMQRSGVGRFVMSYRVPELPPFLRRTYSIEVIARNTDGASTSRDVPIEVR